MGDGAVEDGCAIFYLPTSIFHGRLIFHSPTETPSPRPTFPPSHLQPRPPHRLTEKPPFFLFFPRQSPATCYEQNHSGRFLGILV